MTTPAKLANQLRFHRSEMGSRNAHHEFESVATWVRKLGIVRDVQPNHAWRHRFETVCRSNHWRQDIVDSITGHALETTASEYGDYLVQAQYDLICKLPRYLEPSVAEQPLKVGMPES